MSPATPPESPGTLVWFSRVSDAFEAMLAMIEGAQQSIRLEMYIYTDGAVGRRFLEALTRAAERQVAVRVLIDSLGSLTLLASFWEPLTRAGGELRWFNPLHLHRFTIRNHRKLLLCDDREAIVGGFNIAEEYDGNGIDKGWFDLGVRISGPLVTALAGSFEHQFARADFQHQRFARLRRANSGGGVSTDDGQLLVTAPGRGRNALTRQLLQDLKTARRIRIMTAYFLPTRAIRLALARAARRGVPVQLLLGGKSDVAVAQLASRRFYNPLLRAGVEIYEYQPQILHAKLFVIDDVAYVGSANLDRRSLLINYELLLRLTRPGAARDAAGIFETALTHGARMQKMTWRQPRSFWTRLKELGAFWLLTRLDPLLARWQLRRLRELH